MIRVWKIAIVLSIIIAALFSFWLIKKKTFFRQIIPTTKESSSKRSPEETRQVAFAPKQPSLDEIFDDNHSWIATVSAQKLRTLIATGDIIPARSVNSQEVKRNSFIWPFEKTAAMLKNVDITFINLETPLLKDCPVTQEGMVFCGDSRNVEGLLFTGIDVVSLANNHGGNHDEKGVEETVSLLEKNGITVTGTNKRNIATRDIRGIKFALLGYNDITTPQRGVLNVDEDKIRTDIVDAHSIADVVVVTYHWGVEYRDQPDDRQKYLGHFTIDAGADLVIGNHPHWIQPVEVYKGKLITYAHGNFVFDQMWSEETKRGVVGKYTFYDKQLIDVEYFPVYIKDYGQPSFLEGKEKQKVLDDMKKASQILVCPLILC